VRKGQQWSAPGSILIAGEYLVSEEGGLGLSLASGGRGTLRLARSSALEMKGLCKNRPKFDDSLQSVVKDHYNRITGRDELPSVEILVETGDFFDERGQKIGYGSSATAALLYTVGLAEADDHHEAGDDIVRIALGAHRAWQNGRGSGYDILSSIAGGANVFTGGLRPTHRRISWPVQLVAWIIRGAKPVNSAVAMQRYERWKRRLNAASEEIPILLRMDGIIRELTESCSRWMETSTLLESIHHLSCLAVQLGRELDVPAWPKLPDVFSSSSRPWYSPGRAAAKSLGAGDEITLLLSLPDGLSQRESRAINRLINEGKAAPLRFERDGLRLENED